MTSRESIQLIIFYLSFILKGKGKLFWTIEKQGFFLTQNSEDSTVFQKSMVSMLQMAHKAEKKHQIEK